MIEVPSSPPQTTFGDLTPGEAFRFGGGSVAHIKKATTVSAAVNAVRLSDGGEALLNDIDVVTPAPNARFTLFPSA